MATKTKRVYEPKPGSRVSKKAAQVIGDTLDDLRSCGEAVTPTAFLDRARPKSSPLHKLYEWDDTRAGEEWRLHQSRRFIGGVRVITVTNRPVKGFHNIEYESRTNVTREYARHDLVVDDEDALSQISAGLYSDITAAVLKAVDLGFPKKDRAWKAIQKAVNENRPSL